MDANSRLIARFMCLSAAAHAVVGALLLVMGRLGPTEAPSPQPTVEVTLVSLASDVAEPVATVSLETPAPSRGEAVAPSASVVPFSPIDAPAALAPVEGVDVDPTWGDEIAAVGPRFDSATAGAGATTASAAGSPTTGGANGGAAATGGAEDGAGVRAWLEKHKHYPRAALQRRIEGEVTLHLVLDASGRVIESRIAQSSGHRSLDDEVASMVTRAQPFPIRSRPGAAPSTYRIVIEFHLEEE